MNDKDKDGELLTYEVTAFNFAGESANKIHSDDVAKEYGFGGGLVPGIAVYAYMTYPVAKKLGLEWLNRGTINAKFINPIYSGRNALVQGKRIDPGEGEYEIRVENSEGELCAIGSVGISSGKENSPIISDYPLLPLPDQEQRLEARAASLPAKTKLGTLEFHLDKEVNSAKIKNDYLDDLPLYYGSGAVYHPAYLLGRANRILMANVDLGPWVHTKSEVTNLRAPIVGEKLTIRGAVARSYERRGHELVDLDLAIFDSEEKGILEIKHSAIIRLKKNQ